MLVPILNTDATFTEQAIGTAAIFAFVFSSSYAIWYALKNTIGIRIGMDEELGGQDMWETGSKAYPEFMLGEEDQK
jgi:Amt family ammonium transporter